MLLQAASNLIKGGIDQIFGGANARREWRYKRKEMALEQKYNERNMEIQNQYAIDAFNRENEYNDPSAVAGRYRQAGISPQMALGGAATGAGIASSQSVPDSSSPSGGGHYGGSAGTTALQGKTLLDYKQQEQAIDNEKRLTDAEVDRKKAEADRLRGEDPNSRQDREESETRAELNRVLAALRGQEKTTEEAVTRIQQANAEVAEASKSNNIAMAGKALSKIDEEIKILEERAKQAKFQTQVQREDFFANLEKTKSEARLNRQRTIESLYDAALSKAQAKVAGLSAKEIEERTNVLKAEAKKKMSEAEFTEWENRLRMAGDDPRTTLEKVEAWTAIADSWVGSISDIAGLVATRGASGAIPKQESTPSTLYVPDSYRDGSGGTYRKK